MTLTKSGLLRRLPIRFHELALVVAIVAVVALTTLLDTQHSYLKDAGTNLTNIARLTSMLGIFSLGAAVVIISGGIDLSAGSMIAFSGTMCATFMVLLNPQAIEKATPLGPGVIVLAILGTLVVGLLVGTLHAWLIAVVRLPPFIATLGTLVGLRSLARVICFQVTESMLHAKNTSIPVFDSHFRELATVVKIPVMIFLVLAVVVWLLLSRTVIGRHLYALGGNEEAARLSGIQTERVKWLAYCIGAVTAAIAGILYIGDNSSAEPNNMAVGYELNAIAAAVVGGCSLLGGIGTIPGVVLGVLFLQVVIYGVGIVIKTDSETYQGLVVGLVLIFASVLSRFRDTARPNKQLFAGALGSASIFTLALLAGTLVWLLVNRPAGITAGIVTLCVLLALKVQEVRSLRARVQSPANPPAATS
jgi:ribose/xylose/arabinose/galactoside ABC-type transport system permease subunit